MDWRLRSSGVEIAGTDLPRFVQLFSAWSTWSDLHGSRVFFIHLLDFKGKHTVIEVPFWYIYIYIYVHPFCLWLCEGPPCDPSPCQILEWRWQQCWMMAFADYQWWNGLWKWTSRSSYQAWEHHNGWAGRPAVLVSFFRVRSVRYSKISRDGPDGSGWGFIPIGEGSFESSELGKFSSAASVLSAVSAIKDCRTGWVTGYRVACLGSVSRRKVMQCHSWPISRMKARQSEQVSPIRPQDNPADLVSKLSAALPVETALRARLTTPTLQQKQAHLSVVASKFEQWYFVRTVVRIFWNARELVGALESLERSGCLFAQAFWLTFAQ